MGVTGIGGFFFRARDPEALSAWYARHLGVGAETHAPWETQAGPCVFAPFNADGMANGPGADRSDRAPPQFVTQDDGADPRLRT